MPDTEPDTFTDTFADTEPDTCADTEPDTCADTEPDTCADTCADTYTNTDPDTFAGHSTLQDLFGSIGHQVVNASAVCKELRPFAVAAVEDAPQSNILLEVLAFMDRVILEDAHKGAHQDSCTCSNGELHAIVHLLNRNQFLLEDVCNRSVSVSHKPEPVQYTCETIKQQEIADDEFMKELSLLACDASDE
ncbi:hypothetical protein T484DRAFT_1755023 [Baffinella frigidus]|nr:hypothetical protein T484DRAFT_1755023 [Cryptophyta sp. CCMP2293]